MHVVRVIAEYVPVRGASDCIARGSTIVAANVSLPASVNTPIPIFYAKWNGPRREFARCMRTRIGASAHRKGNVPAAQPRDWKLNTARDREFF